MGSLNSKLMLVAMARQYVLGCLLLAIAVIARAEPPATREEVDAIVRRSETDPNALLELKNARLDLTLPTLRRLLIGADMIVDELQQYRKAGREEEYRALVKTGGHDPEYYAAVLPLVQNIVMSNPNFEWTVASKMQRMTFDLNERYNRTHYLVDSDFPQELGFIAHIPSDAAIRIIGSCLEAPHFPDVDLGDSSARSPASWAREILARVVKKRYGEEIPEDVEAARAWWKENEHRFAQKPSTPETPSAGALGQNNASVAAKGQSPSPQNASPATAQAKNPTDEPSQTPLLWTTGSLLAAALAAVFILISRARK